MSLPRLYLGKFAQKPSVLLGDRLLVLSWGDTNGSCSEVQQTKKAVLYDSVFSSRRHARIPRGGGGGVLVDCGLVVGWYSAPHHACCVCVAPVASSGVRYASCHVGRAARNDTHWNRESPARSKCYRYSLVSRMLMWLLVGVDFRICLWLRPILWASSSCWYSLLLFLDVCWNASLAKMPISSYAIQKVGTQWEVKGKKRPICGCVACTNVQVID